MKRPLPTVRSNLLVAGIMALATLSWAIRPAQAQFEDRFLDSKKHKNGKLWMVVTNFGQFGTDAESGTIWPGTDDPTRQSRNYNRGGLMLGGIVPANGMGRHQPGDLDTLVSEGPSMWSVVDFREMFPHYPDERSAIKVRSTLPNSPFFSPDAVSEEDFISTYTDTFLSVNGYPFAPPKHLRSLGLEIEERSYQFSFSYAEDLVFFDLTIRNVGNNYIRNFYAGFFADNDVLTIGSPNASQRDDAGGFLVTTATGDTILTAWSGEPDGDDGEIPGVVGIRILRPTLRDGFMSYNWWMSDSDVRSSSDWGPITPNVYTGDPNTDDPLGSPEEDEDKYKLMSNGSFDPPQYDPLINEWNPDIPAGADPNDNSRFMIAFGPFGRDSTISDPNDPMFGQTVKIFAPGDSLLFTYVVIGGEGDPAVARSLGTWDPASFDDLAQNSIVASIMFDNPGVDTDPTDNVPPPPADRGDGVPDFTGPPPPPSPPLKVIPGDRTITLDWSAADPNSPGYDPNDQNLPLNFRDPFVLDDPNTPEDESIDFEGFRVLRSETGILGTFEVLADFDIANNKFGRNTGLQFRFVDHVPNGQEFYYAVVSYDRGVPSLGLESLASSPLINLTKAMASPQPTPGLKDKRVWVEPNPYIERSGFENPAITDAVRIEHFRVLDFVNLPPKATVRIFTADGDLVQTLKHDDPNSSRLRWDMLTRTTRAISSGIYIFSVVDEETGEMQVGKFVVIK
jgi:hypothetical protein